MYHRGNNLPAAFLSSPGSTSSAAAVAGAVPHGRVQYITTTATSGGTVGGGAGCSSPVPPFVAGPSQMNTWKRQLADRFSVSCPHEECRLSFLSIAGVLAHFKGCDGSSNQGDYVTCDLCGLRFKQFKSLITHQRKAHFHMVTMDETDGQEKLLVIPQSLEGSEVRYTYQRAMPKGRQIQDVDPTYRIVEEGGMVVGSSEDGPAAAEQRVGAPTTETPDEKAARIMAESRLISTPRRRGRPCKHETTLLQVVDKQNLQYSDPFDMNQEPKSQQQQGPMQLVKDEHGRYVRVIQGQIVNSSDGPIVVVSAQPGCPATANAPMRSMIAASPNVAARSFTVTSAQSGVMSLARQRTPATPSFSGQQLEPWVNNLQEGAIPAPGGLVASPGEFGPSSPLVSSTQRRLDSPARAAGSSPAAKARVSETEDELEARERALAENEAKLAEYERLVLQSEELAKTARKARLQERERMLQLRQEELQKRLADAVSALGGVQQDVEQEPVTLREGGRLQLRRTSSGPSQIERTSTARSSTEEEGIDSTTSQVAAVSNQQPTVMDDENRALERGIQTSEAVSSRSIGHVASRQEEQSKRAEGCLSSVSEGTASNIGETLQMYDNNVNTVSIEVRRVHMENDEGEDVHGTTFIDAASGEVIRGIRFASADELAEIGTDGVTEAVVLDGASFMQFENQGDVMETDANDFSSAVNLEEQLERQTINAASLSAVNAENELIQCIATDPHAGPSEDKVNAAVPVEVEVIRPERTSFQTHEEDNIAEEDAPELIDSEEETDAPSLTAMNTIGISQSEKVQIKGKKTPRKRVPQTIQPRHLAGPTNTLQPTEGVRPMFKPEKSKSKPTDFAPPQQHMEVQQPVTLPRRRGRPPKSKVEVVERAVPEVKEDDSRILPDLVTSSGRALRNRSSIKPVCKDILDVPKKTKAYRHVCKVTASSEEVEEFSSSENNVSVANAPTTGIAATPKRRGRKPKVKVEEDISSDPNVGKEQVTKIYQKRGRKPKQVGEPVRLVENVAEVIPVIEEPPPLEEYTGSGRRKRRAAAAASHKLAETISLLKCNEDGEDDDDIDKDDSEDEAFNEIDVKSHYKAVPKGSGKQYICKVCKHHFKKIKEVELHVISDHADHIEDEVDEESEEEIEEEEDVAKNETDYDSNDDDGEVRSKRPKYARTNRRGMNFLEPSVDLANKEVDFRSRNFELNTFQQFHTRRRDWKVLSELEGEPFLPSGRQSLPFKSTLGQQGGQASSLSRFSATTDEDLHVTTIFAGGPIWASSWCPMSTTDERGGEDCFLALAAHSDLDKESELKRPHAAEVGPGVIQIWQFSSSNGRGRMRMGLAHQYGKVWCLRWCPSGNQCQSEKSEHVRRLGILAAACSDGTVRVFSVCHPDALFPEGDQRIVTTTPLCTLKLVPGASELQCLSLSWYRGLHHRVVAAGFSDGGVALWDLGQPADSCQRGAAGDLFPYALILAHTSSVTALDLEAVDGQEFPDFLVTGSSDRYVYLWDLSRTCTPIQSQRKGFVTDISWMPHRPNQAVVSYDDVYLQSGTRTAILEFSGSGDKIKSHPMIPQNSVIWSHHYNPWLNTIVCGTNEGELVLQAVAPFAKSLDHDKDLRNRRIFAFRTTVQRVSNKPGESFQLKATCEEATQDAVVVYEDFKMKDVGALPAVDQLLPMEPSKMALGDITSFPLASINSVCQSTDLGHLGFIFSGGQSGLGRVLNVEFLSSAGKKII